MRVLALALLSVLLLGAVHGKAARAGRAVTGVVHGSGLLMHGAPAASVGPVAVSVGTVRLPSGRAYVVQRPVGVRGPLPLLVLLHGTDVSAANEITATGFGSLARAHRLLLVAPQSVGPSWNSGNGCCGTPARVHQDDTGFVAAVVADVRRRMDVDPHRIYLVGYSAGGKLSYDVACALPGTFAATATYGAGPQLPCAHAVPRPAFVGYGEADTLEPPAGKPHNSRGEHQPAATTVSRLRALDGCAATGTVTVVGPATVDAWDRCTRGTAVEYVRWAHQTHTFPAAPKVPAAAAAATLMWRFFAVHPGTPA